MIVNIIKSPVRHKRFRVFMDNGKHYDFGLDIGRTFIDEGNYQKRQNYWVRHLANPTEYRLITNLVPSPSLFSAYLLWGDSTNLNVNINKLNNMWFKKHNK